MPREHLGLKVSIISFLNSFDQSARYVQRGFSQIGFLKFGYERNAKGTFHHSPETVPVSTPCCGSMNFYVMDPEGHPFLLSKAMRESDRTVSQKYRFYPRAFTVIGCFPALPGASRAVPTLEMRKPNAEGTAAETEAQLPRGPQPALPAPPPAATSGPRRTGAARCGHTAAAGWAARRAGGARAAAPRSFPPPGSPPPAALSARPPPGPPAPRPRGPRSRGGPRSPCRGWRGSRAGRATGRGVVRWPRRPGAGPGTSRRSAPPTRPGAGSAAPGSPWQPRSAEPAPLYPPWEPGQSRAPPALRDSPHGRNRNRRRRRLPSNAAAILCPGPGPAARPRAADRPAALAAGDAYPALCRRGGTTLRRRGQPILRLRTAGPPPSSPPGWPQRLLAARRRATLRPLPRRFFGARTPTAGPRCSRRLPWALRTWQNPGFLSGSAPGRLTRLLHCQLRTPSIF